MCAKMLNIVPEHLLSTTNSADTPATLNEDTTTTTTTTTAAKAIITNETSLTKILNIPQAIPNNNAQQSLPNVTTTKETTTTTTTALMTTATVENVIETSNKTPKMSAIISTNKLPIMKTTTETTTTTKTIHTIMSQQCGGGIGVQNLRNLWNQRIMENKTQTQQQQQQQQQIIIIQTNTQQQTSLNYLDNYKTGEYRQMGARAQSLHDIGGTLSRDRLLREKDNFYKYKTAEQSAKYRRFECGRPTRTLFRRSTVNGEMNAINNLIIITTTTTTTTATTTTTTTTTPTLTTTSTTTTTPIINLTTTTTSVTSINNNIDNDKPPPVPPPRLLRQESINNELATETLVYDDKNIDKTAEIENDENMKQLVVQEEKEVKEDNVNETTTPANTTTPSSSSSTTTTTSMRKRYSFKTHTKSYPLGGKICRTSTDSGTMNGCGVVGNIVASLTQQFNNIIKNDKKLLDEVKHKNGVLMTRGAHVYKVIEQNERNKASASTAAVCALKRNNSAILLLRSAAVQKQIKRFEVKEQHNEKSTDTTATTTTTTINDEQNDENVDDVDVDSCKKEKYAKIYEKIRLRTIAKNNNVLQQENDVENSNNISNVQLTEDFEPLASLPNQSFLHQCNNTIVKDLTAVTELTEAVNVTLVNKQLVLLNDKESIYEPIEDINKLPTTETKTLIEVEYNSIELNDNDYESIADSTEQRAITISKTDSYHGYEPLELLLPTTLTPPTPSSPSMPAAVTTTLAISPPMPQPSTLYTQLSRNTTDELPELPKPKRRLPKSPMPGKRLNLPPLPAKQQRKVVRSDDFFYDTQDDKENIYCTIKSTTHCYESVQVAKSQSVDIVKAVDSISLASNGYEHISNYRRGSTLTISSDHKTNSLYEATSTGSLLQAGSLKTRHALLQSLRDNHNELSELASNCSKSTLNCERNSCSTADSVKDLIAIASDSYSHLNLPLSDNSDDWVDMTDTDEASTYAKIATPHFIV